MKTFTAKISSKETSEKKQIGGIQNQAYNQQNISVHPVSIPVIQKKILCPCDGRCPRCMPVQPKLKIGQPNDKYEQEADSVADRVMRMPESSEIGGRGSEIGREQTSGTVRRQPEGSCPECEEDKIQPKPIADQITPLVQRKVKSEEDDENLPEEDNVPQEDEDEIGQTKLLDGNTIQRDNTESEEEGKKEEDEDKIESLQLKATPGKIPTIKPGLQGRINSLKGGGQPLPHTVRSYFEPRFGTNFSQVRVHTNAQANKNAKNLKSRAYTHGNDIVFGENQYSPNTNAGQQLLAHELTHVIQQKGNRNQIHRWSVRKVRNLLCNSTDRWVVSRLRKLNRPGQGVYYYNNMKRKIKVFQKAPGGSKGRFVKYIYSPLLGQGDKDKGIIRIVLKLNNKEAATSLFHELTHIEQNIASTTKREYDAWIQTAYFRKRHGMKPRFKGTWRRDVLTPYVNIDFLKSKVKKLYFFKDPRSRYIYERQETVYRPTRGTRIRPSAWRCPGRFSRSHHKWRSRPRVYLNPGGGKRTYVMRFLRDIVDVAQCSYYGMKTTKITRVYPLKTSPVRRAIFKSTRYCTYGRYPRLKLFPYTSYPKGSPFYLLQKIKGMDHDGKIKKLTELWTGVHRVFAEENAVSTTKP